MLVEAIEFPVFVDGRPMTASVVEEFTDTIQHSYRIEFSDGYTDAFTLDEGVIIADNGEASKPYIKAIRHDISNVIGLDTNKFYHIFQDKIDGIITNVWIVEKEDEEEREIYYNIYYNEYYRFEIRNLDDEWICSTRSKAPDAHIDESIAKKAIQILHSLV